MKKTISIDFVCPEGTYIFFGHRIYPKNSREIHANTKCIYQGVFRICAPEGLTPGQAYVLLDIPVTEQTLADHQLCYPQNRQFWDVADIRGPHLRQVLARDTNARQVASALQEGRLPNPVGSCKIIEPVYTTVSEPRLLTTYEKLLLLDQICQALKELYDCEFHKDKFDAHRDLKPSNIMIQRGRETFTVRLIDFASIHSPNSDGTYGMLISRSNSAPENVCGDNGFEVTSKTDVFALAGYIGMLFGSTHPIYEFNSGFWPAEQDDPEEKSLDLMMAYKKAKKLDTDRVPTQPSWLEETLGDAFAWNREPEPVMSQIIRLFRQMIRVVPGNRIGIGQVHSSIRQMIAQLEAQGLARRNLDNDKLYLREAKEKAPEMELTEFCVCLYDRRWLTAHRLSYETATRQIFTTVARSRKKNENSKFGALVFTFGTGSDADTDTEEFHEEFRCFRTDAAEDICQALKEVPEADPELSSVLPWTLTALGNRLKKEKSGAFNGEVHVFMPNVPGNKGFLPCLEDDLKRAARKLRRAYGAKLLLHSVTLNEEMELNPWYDDWKGLISPSGLFGQMKEETGRKIQKTQASSRLIDTDEDAWYIETAGGKRIYIGRRVSNE